MKRTTSAICLTLILGAVASPTQAQWTNRYPKIDRMSHHVYLEGYELPTLTNGPIDPAPAPDGDRVAFSSRGWIWLLDLDTGTATRLTSGRDMDFRPTWSPYAAMLAFVRDDTEDTEIVVIDLASGRQRVFDSPALDLDPAFSADGETLLISSARQGGLDLWAVSLADESWSPLTSAPGSELRPQPLADGRIVYLSKNPDAVRVLDPATGADEILVTERITSMMRPAVAPDGATVAYNWPTQDGYELRLLDIATPSTSIELTASRGLPLTPAWDVDGSHVWFAEANANETMALRRIGAGGGRPETVAVGNWDWGVPTGTVRVRTQVDGASGPAAARLEVLDGDGHPAVPSVGQARFDGEHGRVFFYSEGVVDVVVPAGAVEIAAVQGLATPEVSARVEVAAGGTSEATLTLAPVWDAAAAGWRSADHHFHLNYGGPYRLTPDDIAPMMRGEALDVATPLLANLHNRFEDQRFWGWAAGGSAPMIRFGQEVRSHFLGHLGFIGITDLHWPWVWGPGYQVHGRDDRTNAEATAFARAQGGLSTYVHPVSRAGASPPVELVADGVLGDFDLLEVVCLWSDEMATAELWYHFLNLGVPIAPTAGSDVMNNFYRTMAIGSTRVYVHTGEADDWGSYLDGLAAGRSFVTNGPLIELDVAGSRPGEVIGSFAISAGTGAAGLAAAGRPTAPAEADGATPWRLALHTAVPVDRVEILVNGEVITSIDGPHGPHASLEGAIDLPAGGWVAARATGSDNRWPFQDSYAFAHTAPVWIGSVGGIDRAARRGSAEALLPVLEAAEGRLRAGYGPVPTPRIGAQMRAARDRLVAILEDPG